ncbi:hypothetical protein COY16_01680 [Candidatus Roizmanbacteria bacterium CG_4_10_14_0_2_um_filter_39_13]|uniref:Uncharacterized protein n=1 Tax=Candidatus Roizmanbacteria bacterium CG_4_10_14_0_2_um_filter_39_13 TaxID=1974825 RepID=A0A2M7U0C7_9BACT|nr:MAG: hypothetical protein COY16_01680 [Candidatus Roizmanbacteria bacterium CG_4_10_14_0_2_um_filter_39_13]
MRLSINTTIIGIIVLLIGVNIAIFIQGIKLGNEISFYETEIASLNQENIESEQAIYKLESHVWTASLAAELEYGKYNAPMYSQLPKYARNK